MLSGILLILVTMLAVLGAYYLTELASQASAKRKTLKNAVVLLCAQDAEQMWAAVLDARAKLPDAALVVLSPLLLITSLAIWLDSPGSSPIFSQWRVGRNLAVPQGE